MELKEHKQNNIKVKLNIFQMYLIILLNRIRTYLDKRSETFCVRKTPTTESTTDPFHFEKRRFPVPLRYIIIVLYNIPV